MVQIEGGSTKPGSIEWPEDVWLLAKVKEVQPRFKSDYGESCKVIFHIPKLKRDFHWYMPYGLTKNGKSMTWKWRLTFSACSVKTDEEIRSKGEYVEMSLMSQTCKIRWSPPDKGYTRQNADLRKVGAKPSYVSEGAPIPDDYDTNSTDEVPF